MEESEAKLFKARVKRSALEGISPESLISGVYRKVKTPLPSGRVC